MSLFYYFVSKCTLNFCLRKTVPFLSREEEVFVLLAGRPKDPTFVSDLERLKDDMEISREVLTFKKGSETHRRGKYPHMSTGISYGGGSKVCRLILFLKPEAHSETRFRGISVLEAFEMRRFFESWNSTKE